MLPLSHPKYDVAVVVKHLQLSKRCYNNKCTWHELNANSRNKKGRLIWVWTGLKMKCEYKNCGVSSRTGVCSWGWWLPGSWRLPTPWRPPAPSAASCGWRWLSEPLPQPPPADAWVASCECSTCRTNKREREQTYKELSHSNTNVNYHTYC